MTTVVSNVTCLGCGCACDDIVVTVDQGKIVQAAQSCPIGRAWFGDGTVPSVMRQNGAAASFEAAIASAADLLTAAAGRVLIYLGLDLSAEAQRQAVALADMLRGAVDSETSETAAGGLLAAQRRGRTAATLGELRNRADILVFWGVDPAVRYPRFLSRYAVEPVGTHVPAGRAGRTVVSVAIGPERGPDGADLALALAPGDEIAALSVMRARLLGRSLGELPPALHAAAELAMRLASGKYIALVHDAEPNETPREPLRAEGLLALAQALNTPTRAAVISLRGGGNRSGAEAVLTWQTGYPFAVDFRSGVPRYMPRAGGMERLVHEPASFAAALVVGSTTGMDERLVAALRSLPTIVIGPRASDVTFSPRVAIDTGIAGIHDGGTAYRMDEVPLPLRPSLLGPRTAVDTLVALTREVVARRANAAPAGARP